MKKIESESEITKELESEIVDEAKMGSETESESEDDGQVYLADVVSEMDISALEDYLAGLRERPQPDPELRGLVGYLENAFSQVSSPVQFPCAKMDKLGDVIHHPLYEVSESLYGTVTSFIQQFGDNQLTGFIISSIAFYLHASVPTNKTPLNSQLAVYVVLSILLRSRRSALTVALPFLNMMEPMTAGDKLPILVWIIAQVSDIDLSLGLYIWARLLLPQTVSRHKCDPPSMDLILQLVEHIVSDPDARTILKTNSVQEGCRRLIPPPSFETLLRLTFPASSKRTKDTKRFEAVYPLLKVVALANTPRKEATKQLTLEIFTLCLNLAGEGNPELAKEATSIAFWCVTKNVDCCNHWDNVYDENPEASVALLRKLVDEWKDHSHKSLRRILNRTVNSFMLKNKKQGGANACLFQEADKYCKEISRGSGVRVGVAISAVVLVVAIAAAPVGLSSNLVGFLYEYINAMATALKNALPYVPAQW